MLRVDARCEPIVSQLTAQYTANYQRSSSVETRLWHGVFDLVKAFTAAYQATLKAGYNAGEQKRWKTVLPRVLVRLAHYKAIDGKFRLFRYGHWIPAQWRELHELYEFARMRGWQREPLSFGAGAFSQPGRVAGAGIYPVAAAHAPGQRQFHAGPGRVGGALAGGVDPVADADAPAGYRGELLRRPVRHAGPQAPG